MTISQHKRHPLRGDVRDAVAIRGFGKNGRDVFKLDRDRFEFWGFNDPGHDFADYDRWFQLHKRDYLAESYTEGWARQITHFRGQRNIPVYMWDAYDDLPIVRRFPKAEVETLTARGTYHQGSFDWIFCYALWCGFSEIHMYGIGNMQCITSGEPVSARACLEYWIGVAEGRGVKVHVPDWGTDLFKTLQFVRSERQYGWDNSLPVIDL